MNINPLRTVEQGRVIEIDIRSLVSRKTNLITARSDDIHSGVAVEVSRYVYSLAVQLDDIWEAAESVLKRLNTDTDNIEVIAFGTVDISPMGERHVIVFREKEEEG